MKTFYLSFSWGGARIADSRNLQDAEEEAINAAYNTTSDVNVLDEDLKVLSKVTYQQALERLCETE